MKRLIIIRLSMVGKEIIAISVARNHHGMITLIPPIYFREDLNHVTRIVGLTKNFRLVIVDICPRCDEGLS